MDIRQMILQRYTGSMLSNGRARTFKIHQKPLDEYEDFLHNGYEVKENKTPIKEEKKEEKREVEAKPKPVMKGVTITEPTTTKKNPRKVEIGRLYGKRSGEIRRARREIRDKELKEEIEDMDHSDIKELVARSKRLISIIKKENKNNIVDNDIDNAEPITASTDPTDKSN